MAGFRAHSPSIRQHASQVGHRGDQVHQVGGGVGGASIGGGSLGNVGSQTAASQQRFTDRAHASLTRAGSGMQGQSSLLNRTSGNIDRQEDHTASTFRGIHPDARSTAPAGTGGAPRGGTPAGSGPAGKSLDDFRGPDGKIRVDSMSDEEYAKFAPHWNNLMKTEPNKAWFWSGGHVNSNTGKYYGSIQQNTGKVAGGNTLEGLLEHHGIQMPGGSDNSPSSVQKWKDASMSLAHNAQGTVHVALPNTPATHNGQANGGSVLSSRRPNNVFDMDEFPILRHNPNVTKIVAYDTNYKTTDTLWERGQP